jgi:hypothetical protein
VVVEENGEYYFLGKHVAIVKVVTIKPREKLFSFLFPDLEMHSNFSRHYIALPILKK